MKYSTYSVVLMFGFHDQLLVADMTKIKAKGIGQKKKGGKEKDNIDSIFNHYIEKLNKDLMRSTDHHLGNSMDFTVPDCK